MYIFKPTIYKKNIYEINYEALKKLGITCLVFDLDNTLGLITDKQVPDKTKKLIEALKKDFLILIISNNNRKRISVYLDELDIDGITNSMKPFTRGLKMISCKYKLSKNKMAIIGDQMFTDIQAGNRYGIMTILVDPLGEKDLKITAFNRWYEDKVINKYQKLGIFERGRYYE